MKQKLIDYLEQKIKMINYDDLKYRIIHNTDYYFEAIIEAHNCFIKISEGTRQFQLFISKKDDNWIAMYWVASYLKMVYQIFSVDQLDGDYDIIMMNQIDYLCHFISDNLQRLDNFYMKKIDNEIKIIKEKANDKHN